MCSISCQPLLASQLGAMVRRYAEIRRKRSGYQWALVFVIRLTGSLGRRSVNLLPAAQWTTAVTYGVVEIT